MRSLIAIHTLLIQFCVQIFPLAYAEDVIETPLEDSSVEDVLLIESAEEVPELHADSGALLIVTETETGAVLAGSGVLPSETGSLSVPEEPLILSSLPNTSPSFVHIVVTEVAWMGSDQSTADEWIEIAAFGSGSAIEPRSLSGWTLSTVKGGTETVVARFPSMPLMASGAVWIVANYAADQSRLSIDPVLVTTGMSLPNTQLLIRLRDDSGIMVDEIDDGIGVPFAGTNASGSPKATMERMDPWHPGTEASNWSTATRSIGFDDGITIFGTPGTFGDSVGQYPMPEVSVPPPPIEGVPVVPVQSPPALRLTEVLPNPPGIDTDEWIEIGSFDALPVDLSEVVLRIGTLRFGLEGTVLPGEHRVYGKQQSGLPLSNVGATIELLWRNAVIDAWTYDASPEGVSSVRMQDGSVSLQCVPSPGRANTATSLDPFIAVQSSSFKGGKLSLNLEARVTEGSMAGASCSWSYPDGYASNSCNPPSHTIVGPVSGDVIMTLQDACDTTVIRTLRVELAAKAGAEHPFVCTPSSFSGVVLSEVLPNPIGDETEGEWIELANVTDSVKPLCGWSVDNGEQGKTYTLDAYQLHPGDRLVLPRSETRLALANADDAIRLIAPFIGGGSGVVEIVRYARAPEGLSFARRDDGVWLWTDPTPMEHNVFAAVAWPEFVSVHIVQALPNPRGNDALGGEWVELRNETAFPLPLTGWLLQTASKEHALDHIILAPRERKRLPVPASFLVNTNGVVRLMNREGLEESQLAWRKAVDGYAVQPPLPAGTAEGLMLSSMDDCTTWRGQGPDGSASIVRLSGVQTIDNAECINSLLTLIENKKIDLQMYANGETVAWVGGANVTALLLRMGMVVVDAMQPSVHAASYERYETEARDARRGFWALKEHASLLDTLRLDAAQRHIVAGDGLRILSSHASGILAPRDAIDLRTNVPATILLSVDSGSFRLYDGPLSLEHDAVVRVRAVADVQSASGTSIVSESSFLFGMLRQRYASLRVSEVYPSPMSGESEWVELWNPTAEPVSLLGWTIDDAQNAGSKPAPLSLGGIMGPGEKKVIEGLPIAWNNGGDRVRLVAPNGRVVHEFSYGSTKKGMAVALSFTERGVQRGVCLTVHATPGAENRCAEARAKPATSSTKKAAAAMRSVAKRVRYKNFIAEVATLHEEHILFSQLRRQTIPVFTSMHDRRIVAVFPLILGLIAFCAAGALRLRRGIE